MKSFDCVLIGRNLASTPVLNLVSIRCARNGMHTLISIAPNNRFPSEYDPKPDLIIYCDEYLESSTLNNIGIADEIFNRIKPEYDLHTERERIREFTETSENSLS